MSRLNRHILPIVEDDVVLGKEMIEEIKQVLPKYALGADLKKLKGYAELRSHIKDSNLQVEYIKQMKVILDHFEVNNENKYNVELLLFACQVAEDFFITKKHMGDIKRKSVIEVCKKYFNEDEELTLKLLELVLEKIERSTLCKRLRTRIVNFFLNVVSK